MKVGQYIYSKLNATTAVTDLVGSRIYPVLMPQSSDYPAIVFFVENKPWGVCKDRPSDKDEASVTFNFWADVSQGANAYAELDNIDLAVRNALDYVSGTAGSVTVVDCEYRGSVDGVNPDLMLLSRTATYRFITKN